MGASELPDYASNLRTLEGTRRGEKWARKALEYEAATVAWATVGDRNGLLNTAAFRLGRKVAGGYLTEAEVIGALQSASTANGYTQEHGQESTLATIRSGLQAGLAEPEHPQDRADYQRPSQGPTIITPTPPRASQFFSAATLKHEPVEEQPWLVRDLVPDQNVTLFYGDGGTGKSLLGLQLAVGVASGCGWLGMPVKQGPVIYFSAEDDKSELHRRVDAILRSTGRSYDDVASLTLRSLAGEDALLAIESGLALMQSELFNELEQRAAEEAPALVLIDTAADVYPANENDRAKVRKFIGILRGLALRQKCAVMLLAHPSLSGLSSGSGMSGSTAWNNSARSRLYLERIRDGAHEPDSNKRRLTTLKANHGPTGGTISLTWQRGVFVADDVPTGLDRAATNAKAERVFLKLLDEYTARGLRLNPSSGPNYAPKVFAELPKAEGMTKRALAAAMQALLDNDTLTILTDGPPSRRVTYVARRPS